MLKTACIILFACSILPADAQLPYSLHSNPGVTGCYTSQHADMNSFMANPAALGQLRLTGISAYGENVFLIPGLSRFTVASSIHSGKGNFGIAMKRSGHQLYGESEFSVAYGRKWFESLDIGVQFHYVFINMKGFGKISVPGFELGLMLHPSEKLHGGIKFRNVTAQGLQAVTPGKLPAVFVLGLGYETSPQFHLSVEIARQSGSSTLAEMRLQYEPHPSIRIRTGIRSDNGSVWLSLGWKKKNMRIDIASSFHQQLGITPGLQLSFEFPGK